MGTPIIDGRSVEATLYGLHEFRETAEELTFDTGDELFKYFRRILRGTVKDDWDTIVTDNGFDVVNGKTEADFNQCLSEWKLTFVTEDSRQELVDYLQTVSKPRALQVEVFVQRLKTMARYVADLPFAGVQPPTLNNTQIKNIVYKAMPLAWQQHFIRSNRGISAVTLLELQNFMSNERTFADSTPANRGGERVRGGGYNRGNASTYGRRGHGYEGRSKRPGRENNNKRNVRQRWGNDSICRKHGGHSWGQCYDNPRGQNFRPPRNPRGNGNGRGQNNFRGLGRNDYRAPFQPQHPPGGRANNYYQQQQPGVTGGTQGKDRNLDARGNASQNDNYYHDEEKQNPRGALIPAREAESQKKMVQETESNETKKLTFSSHSSCLQNNIIGETSRVGCQFTNCFLCEPTDHIRIFRATQKLLFEQTNTKTYDAECVYQTFFSEE
jgi:hypothetical protein